MITRDRAVQILSDHGKTPTENTEFSRDLFGAVEVPKTSFDDLVGKKDHYEQMEVLGFLGYCCPLC